MLTREDDVDACALHRQGWTISAIARHLGPDRKTIRAYVTGRRTAGARARAAGDSFDAFVDYAAARRVLTTGAVNQPRQLRQPTTVRRQEAA